MVLWESGESDIQYFPRMLIQTEASQKALQIVLYLGTVEVANILANHSFPDEVIFMEELCSDFNHSSTVRKFSPFIIVGVVP